MSNHHPCTPDETIFKLVRPFDHKLMPQKFHDDICNGLKVITLTKRQTNTSAPPGISG